MNNMVLILPQREKGLFSQTVKYELSDKYIKVWMKDSPRALRKTIEIMGGGRAVISKDAMDMRIFENYTFKYKNCSNEQLLCLMEKCIKALINERNIKLPFYEIFIFAIPDIAVKIIQKLRNYARIFTVVYSGEFDNGIFDGLYFKYGIITRHLQKIKHSDKENSLIISTDSTDYIPAKMYCPVISLADKSNRADAILVKNVALNILGNSFIDSWKGNPSVFMADLLGIEIDNKVKVDTTKKADEIFMLDITGI